MKSSEVKNWTVSDVCDSAVGCSALPHSYLSPLKLPASKYMQFTFVTMKMWINLRYCFISISCLRLSKHVTLSYATLPDLVSWRTLNILMAQHEWCIARASWSVKNLMLLKITLLWTVNYLHLMPLLLIFGKPAVASFTWSKISEQWAC